MAQFYIFYKDLLLNEKYSDLTAVCGSDGQRFPLHRAVVCGQAKFFDDDDKIPATAKEVSFPDIDPQAFRTFLTYLYTGNYEDEPYSSIPLPRDYHYSPKRGGPKKDRRGPSPHTALAPEELEEALAAFDLEVQEWELDERLPTPRASAHVAAALEAAQFAPAAAAADGEEGGEEGENAYAEKVRELVRNWRASLAMHLLADRFGADGLRLLARNRLCRTGLNLVIEAARNSGAAGEEEEEEGSQQQAAAVEEIWQAIADGVGALWAASRPGAAVRRMARVVLGVSRLRVTHRTPPRHARIEALLEEHEDLRRGVEEFLEGELWPSPHGWRQTYCLDGYLASSMGAYEYSRQ